MGQLVSGSARRGARLALVGAVFASLLALAPVSSFAAPGDSPRPTWSSTASITVGTVIDAVDDNYGSAQLAGRIR